MSLNIKYHLNYIDSPFWSFAIHDGHHISSELSPFLLLTDQQRLREEDPFTATIAELPTNHFFVATSRFQLDLNRNHRDCIYLQPAQAWGLKVYNHLPKKYIKKLYTEYVHIYELLDEHIKMTIEKFGYFIILDFHSYNAKRDGQNESMDMVKNPQINLGTFYNDKKWIRFIADYISFVKNQTLCNSPIDIRENIKFKGGNLAQHIISNFGDFGCVLSIEFRKDFMDEWSNVSDAIKIEAYKQLMLKTVQYIKSYFYDDK